MFRLSGAVVSVPFPSSAPPRLKSAAEEFEAQMMKELLKPLSSCEDAGEEDAGTGSGSILGDFGAETLGRALSANGGFGIANEIVQSLSPDRGGSQPGEEIRNLLSGSVLKRTK